jgi:hypothetical protein
MELVLNQKRVNSENLSNLWISHQKKTKKNLVAIDSFQLSAINAKNRKDAMHEEDALNLEDATNHLDAIHQGDISHREDASHLLNTKKSYQLTDSEKKQSFILNLPNLRTINEANSQQLLSSNAEHVENNQLKKFRNIQYVKVNSLFKKKLATLDIGNLDLSLKLYIELKNKNINTISDFLKYFAEEDLLTLKNIHKNSLKELKDVLKQVNIYLRNSSNT